MNSKKDVDVKQLKKRIALMTSERAVRDAILSSIGVGVIATDESGTITEINQTALSLLKYKRSELLGKWFPAVIPALNEDGSPISSADRPIAQTFMLGKAVTYHAYYKDSEGKALPVSLVVSPVILRGKPIGAVEIFRDITSEIASDKLKTDFISIASHQLRTPLSAIHTYSHMLLEGYAGKLNDQQTSFLNVIASATDRMNDLTTTLLNVTRVEVGNISIASEPTDLASIANETFREVLPYATKKLIDLSLTVEPNLPSIKTDRLVVREVLTNLLTNSIKYSPKGGQVSVQLYTKKNDIIFEVKDNGYGIPKAAQSNIFTKFFRASNAALIEPSGTGLGLYLAKILVDKLNGELWFKSREKSGTTFYLSLSKKGTIERIEKFRLET